MFTSNLFRSIPGTVQWQRGMKDILHSVPGKKGVYLTLLVFAFVALLAACAPAGGESLQVNDVWARPGLADGNSAAYFVIENGTGAEDSLLSASSDVAGAVELHMTKMENGNMQMMHQEEVAVPMGQTEFKPGGLHVMFIGLNQDLNPGDTFSLTLNFARAGEIPLEVTVAEP